ncbi:MAG: hypothetical protein HKN33_16235, partial [Pyrinomonadaceae bacterium]|nr:hypothetical protein [Pyrinomonadaceae bacterium]
MNRYRLSFVVVFVLSLCIAAVAQGPAPKLPEGMTGSDARDPRANLPSGLFDAGEVAYGMRLVNLVKKPSAFRLGTTDANDPKVKKILSQIGFPANANIPDQIKLVSAQLAFANSDLAFQGDRVFMGNFYGVNIYDVADPSKAKLLTSMVCPGGQGDVSVYKNLMFMSVEMPNGRLDCGTQGFTSADGQPAPAAQKDRFRGVRIFDISNIKSPKQVGAVQTCRGSHTHTLVKDPNDKENVYIYVSGTSFVRPAEELAGCSGGTPDKNPDTARFRIDIIKVPVASPADSKIVNRPQIFADETGKIDALTDGGSHDNQGRPTKTDQCHDITAYSEIGLAGGACSGNGILLDIRDPANPKRIDAVNDSNYAYWHSATFSNDGKKVVFTDEWGGGLGARCRENDPNVWGANALFNIEDNKLKFASYYKMPAAQGNTENCVAHNGSIIPVPGRDIKVQAWYQGGISIMDFTDIEKPIEIAYFDRGPIDPKMLIMGGSWSAYWYNGYIYSSEIARGLDILELKPTKFLSQNEIDAARSVKVDEFNVQTQER